MLNAPQAELSLVDLGLSDPELQALLREGLQIIAEGLTHAIPESVAGVASRNPEQAEMLALASTCEPELIPSAVKQFRTIVRRRSVWAGSGRARREETDLVTAPLRDRQGVVQALLWVATPRRTGELHDDRRIAAYAAQAERELQAGVERHRLNERARLAETARQVVRTATARLDLEAALLDCERALVSGFRADEVGVRSYRVSGIAEGRAPANGMPPAAVDVVRRTAHRCWAEQRVAAITEQSWPTDLLNESDHAVAMAAVIQRGLRSWMLVPIGAGHDCLGHFLLGRADDELPWSAEEARVALEIGHDLGRAVRVARSFARERELSERLQSLDVAKSRLISTVSHELKTPLAAIMGHVELVGSAPELSERARRSLTALSRGTARLRSVVDDLLLMSKVANPMSSISPAAVDLGDLIDDLRELVAMPARRGKVRLLVEAPEAAVKTWGDREELDRALGNLVSNAVKYSDDQGIVTLGLSQVGDEAVFTCADEGLGISPEDRDQLFTEFFRSTNPVARERPGTGLGLAIARRIVERHRGRIEVESALGIGSTFRVFLPVAESAAILPTDILPTDILPTDISSATG